MLSGYSSYACVATVAMVGVLPTLKVKTQRRHDAEEDKVPAAEASA